MHAQHQDTLGTQKQKSREAICTEMLATCRICSMRESIKNRIDLHHHDVARHATTDHSAYSPRRYGPLGDVGGSRFCLGGCADAGANPSSFDARPSRVNLQKGLITSVHVRSGSRREEGDRQNGKMECLRGNKRIEVVPGILEQSVGEV